MGRSGMGLGLAVVWGVVKRGHGGYIDVRGSEREGIVFTVYFPVTREAPWKCSGFSETARVRQVQVLGEGAYVRKPYVLKNIGVAVRRELERGAG